MNKRFKVTHFFSYLSEGVLAEGERMNDNVEAETPEAAEAAHLEMVKSNEPNLVEVFADRTLVEEFYKDEADPSSSESEN